MKVLCVTNNYENKTLYNFAKMILGNKVKRYITARRMEILAEINGEDISVLFMTHQQDTNQFQGLSPDLLVFHGDIPDNLKQFAGSVRMTGGLVMEL